MKRGQAEMIGLALVVILFVLGGLFYLKFVVLRSDDVSSASHFSSVQARYLLHATVSVTLCEDVTLTDALGVCASSGIICGEDACGLITTTITQLTERLSFHQVQFTAESPSGVFLSLGLCAEGIVSPHFYFTSHGRSIDVYYTFC